MTQRVVNYKYGTGNPVLPNGSIDVRDGIDNLQSFDVFMNAEEDTYNQRDGEVVQTVAGAIKSIGFKHGGGDFTTGFTVMPGQRNYAWYDQVSLNWYSYLGLIPTGGYSVAPGTNPVGDNNWAPRTDQLLREDLSDPEGATTHPEFQLARWREIGDPRGWGGVGDGIADDTVAVENALRTGKLDVGDASKVWRLTRTITHTGKVHITGEGTIILDYIGTSAEPAFAIKITDGSGSVVDGGIKLIPKTIPYTIRRVPGTWVIDGTWEQRFDGYIPTPQDSDVWSSIPQSVKDHNSGVGTGLLFTVSSAAGGSNVKISGVRGSQVNIVVQGYSDSTVEKCSAGLGQLTLGGVFINNGVVRAYNQALLGFRLPIGKNNKVLNNDFMYASLCGVVFGGNDNFKAIGNSSCKNAESGIKTLQYDGVAGITEDRACRSTRGTIIGNTTSDNYYDGLDIQSTYGVPYEFAFGGHVISDNTSERNRLTGGHTNSASSTVSGNFFNGNGDTGFQATGPSMMVFGNKARDNCAAPSNPQAFQMVIQGDDCVSFGNSCKGAAGAAYSTYDYIHTGLFGAEPTSSHEGIDFNNYTEEGLTRQLISATIRSSIVDYRADIVTRDLTASKPVTVTGNYTVTDTDYSLSCFTSTGAVITLPPVASNVGRVLEFRNTSAYGILSASNNVGQITGGSPTNTIMPATTGSWCKMQSDGAVWLIMAKG